MTATSAAASRALPGSKPVFWEVLWRSAGLQAVGLFIFADVLYGYRPGVGATGDTLIAFYSAEPLRIFLAAALTGLAVLNLMWFAAAIRTTLADAGKDGWGAAATASSAAFGGMLLIITSITATTAYIGANASNPVLVSGLNDLSWSMMVLIAFPRAMLIMSAAFGLWRAKLISNGLFALGVLFVILGVLSGTTWISGSVWAPDGDFSRFVAPSLLFVWVVIVSWVLFTRNLAARAGW